MAKFTDAAGREWDIELDYTTADEIKASLDIDLIDAEAQDALYLRLAMETRLVVSIAWAFVKPKADEAKIDEKDFQRAMKTAAIRDARKAIVEALTDFCPSPEYAEAMKKVFRAAETKLKHTFENISEAGILDAMNAATESESDDSVGNTLANSVGPTSAP